MTTDSEDILIKVAKIIASYQLLPRSTCHWRTFEKEARQIIECILDDLGEYAWDHGVISTDMYCEPLKKFLEQYAASNGMEKNNAEKNI